MLPLNPNSVERLGISIESLCMDFALFASGNASEVNRILEPQLLKVMKRREDRNIINAWSARITKQRKDRLGPRGFRMTFEALFLE
jgi:hypothetical protein